MLRKLRAVSDGELILRDISAKIRCHLRKDESFQPADSVWGYHQNQSNKDIYRLRKLRAQSSAYPAGISSRSAAFPLCKHRSGPDRIVEIICATHRRSIDQIRKSAESLHGSNGSIR
jgi:hypothetical protein